MTLVPGDPLAHRALDSLLRAEASVRRRLSTDLEREGLSASGFSVLVVLTTAGGAHGAAHAAPAPSDLQGQRDRGGHDARAPRAGGPQPPRARPPRGDRGADGLGQELVDRLFPEHTARVQSAFAVLDEAEKRSLAEICRKLRAAYLPAPASPPSLTSRMRPLVVA